MNQQIETLIKAGLILLSMLLGTETIPLFDEKLASLVSAAVAGSLAVALDQWSTRKLKKQGIVSTSALANVEAPGSPEKVLKAELKADLKKEG